MTGGMIPDVDASIRSAIRFIVGSRGRDGLWRDFHTLAGRSSEWVTAFVAHALCHAVPSHPAAISALYALRSRQRRSGGWGYNANVPPDCDSTAWVLMALAVAHRAAPSAVESACPYLVRHMRTETGGFSTYAQEDRIESYIGASSLRSVRGWLATHPCVTAVALQALMISGRAEQTLLDAAVSYLAAERGRSGLWESYWWPGFAYATCHALRALAWAGAMTPSEHRRTGLALLASQGRQGEWSLPAHPGGSVFETAFALLALLPIADAATTAGAHQAAFWLAQMQQDDGGWPTTPILRIPTPETSRPRADAHWRENSLGTGVLIEDNTRVFTAAAALWALVVYRSAAPDLSRLRPPGRGGAAPDRPTRA